MDGDMIPRVNHILGKRMISSGMDGMSRVVTKEGVMKEIPILEFFPIHLSAVDRSFKVIPWIGSL